MKKGLSYIDWILSFGIFIILLILIFIVFQPAFITGEDKSYLTAIVKDGLEKDTFANLDIYPVFVEVNSSSVNDFKIEEFPKLLDVDKTYVVNQQGNKLIFNLFQYAGKTDIFLNDMQINSGINTIWIINSNEILNTDSLGDFSGSSFPGVHTIGINEQAYGFYPENFNKRIANKTYENLKYDWRFPLNNDLQIFIYNASDLENPIYSYKEKDPPTFANIKTFFYSANSIVVGAGNQKPIKQEPIFIQIKVW